MPDRSEFHQFSHFSSIFTDSLYRTSLERLSNVGKQREAQLRQAQHESRGKDRPYDLMMWKRANQHHFKGKVFDPIRLVISPVNRMLIDLCEAPISIGAFNVSSSLVIRFGRFSRG